MNVSPLPAASTPAAFGASSFSARDFSETLKKEPPSKNDEHAAPPTDNLPSEEATETSRMYDSSAPQLADTMGAELPVGGDALPVAVDLGTTQQVLSARIFGLHLQASGYLSGYVVAPTEGRALSLPPTDDPLAPLETVPERQGATSGVQVTFVQAVDQATSAEPVGLAVAPISQEASMEWIDSAERLFGVGTWNEFLWQGRSVRLFQSQKGGAVLWLRDYSLSESEARSLALDLMRRVREQGVDPRCVMWNGHPIWSSNHLDQGI